jgi:hypothetical protein
MTEWTNLVKTMFKNGRKTNKNYKLKNAMKDAAKIYKKHKSTNVHHKLKHMHHKSRKGHHKSRKGRKRRGGGDVNEGGNDGMGNDDTEQLNV